jgi:hypothetical protein
MPTSLPRSSASRAMRAAAAVPASDGAPQTVTSGKRRSAQRRLRPAATAIPAQSRIVFRGGAISLR